MRTNFPSSRRTAGFTVLEMITVVLVVLILIVISMQIYGSVVPRVDRVRCTANMRSLHAAAALYVQEHRTWPQVPIKKEQDQVQYADTWIKLLRPYGATAQTWTCPTTQRNARNPDLSNPANVRIDYLPNPFGRGPQLPYKWAKQPWFIERFDEHKNGNLVIFPDGHVESALELLQKKK